MGVLLPVWAWNCCLLRRSKQQQLIKSLGTQKTAFVDTQGKKILWS